MHSTYGYSQATGRLLPKYICSGTRIDGPNGCNESVSAEGNDAAISELVAQKLAPEALAVTADVRAEVNRRRQEHMRCFELQLEKARHEEDMARIRYMSVDPTNRLAALELEADWNRKLRGLDDARRRLDEEAGRNRTSSESELAEAIQSISRDFKQIWNAPGLKNEDRKRIIRYLIKDVAIRRTDHHTAVVQICFQGGAVQTLEAPIAKPRHKVIETPRDVIDFLRRGRSPTPIHN